MSARTRVRWWWVRTRYRVREDRQVVPGSLIIRSSRVLSRDQVAAIRRAWVKR